MAKATIKSATGATITIEGDHREVAQIISEIEMKSAVQQTKNIHTVTQLKKRDDRRRRSASDLVIELREEGFFDKAKSLSDISKELENRGHLYPTTTLSGILLALVQKRLLGRKRENGKWVYGK